MLSILIQLNFIQDKNKPLIFKMQFSALKYLLKSRAVNQCCKVREEREDSWRVTAAPKSASPPRAFPGASQTAKGGDTRQQGASRVVVITTSDNLIKGHELLVSGRTPPFPPWFEACSPPYLFQQTGVLVSSVTAADSTELHINKWLKKKAMRDSVEGAGKEGIATLLTAKFFCKQKLL